jgi:cobalt-zinc-cadmium efflux system membrane fusion protein
MPRRIHSTLCCAAFAIFAIGCEHGPPSGAKRPVEDAPYRMATNGLLQVRPDLLGELKFAKAEKSRLLAELHGVGEIDFSPGSLTALRIPFDGIVESVEVSAGVRVAKDDILARIRSSELARMRADIRRLTSELIGQNDALRRIKDLTQSGVISDRRVIELEAKIGSLEAERRGVFVALRAARTSEEGEDLFELRSPRDGEVIARTIEPGEQAHAPENQPAFIVADTDALIVRAYFPERDAPLLKPGFPCRFEIAAVGDAPLTGRVESVVRAIDRDKRTVSVTCTIDGQTAAIRAHMQARITVMVQGEPEIIVPRDAVLLRRDSRVVLVRRGENELERRPVNVGSNIDTRVVILSGVNEGEEVVTEGAVLLDGELDRLL